MGKASVESLKGLPRSLLLPLYFRAVESKRPDPIVRDEQAAQLVERIDFDFTSFEGQTVTHVATLLRVREFDRFSREFLAENPDAVIVNIGCGLDTRFRRVDNGRIEWYDLDLPEVIALRQGLLGQTPRLHYLPSSALDFSWTKAVQRQPPRPLLFLAEGVFPYLSEGLVKSLVLGLTQRFPGSVLVFDAVSPLQAELSFLHPSLQLVDVRFRWGLADPKELETWDPQIHLLRQVFYFDRFEPRLGALAFLQLFPQISKGFSVVEYELGPSPEVEPNRGNSA